MYSVQLELVAQWVNTWLLMWNRAINKQALLLCPLILWSHSAGNVAAPALLLRTKSRRAEIGPPGCEFYSHLGYFLLFRVVTFWLEPIWNPPPAFKNNSCKRAKEFCHSEQAKWETSWFLNQFDQLDSNIQSHHHKLVSGGLPSYFHWHAAHESHHFGHKHKSHCYLDMMPVKRSEM